MKGETQLNAVFSQNFQFVSSICNWSDERCEHVPSQNFNEIMPAIYSRFMEKEARQWRQIYKVSTCTTRLYFGRERHRQALQLLEYLVKNGSERVVDDARSHIGTIKMLRNFYYVDEKGKDQGINGTLRCSGKLSSPC